jgi:hydrogenase maturation protease
MNQVNNKTAILGFGNPVRADDGVGIYVIDRLKEQKVESDTIGLFDMGTSAFEVLFKLRDYSRIILIDAVINTEEPVGTVFKLPASEVEAEIEDDPMVFLHSLKWSQALSYARKMLGDDYPEDVEVYLIAIEDTRFNVGMTQEAQKGADKVAAILLEEFVPA